MEAITWLVAHWGAILELLGALGVLVSMVVGLLPASSSKSKAIAVLGRLSALTHKDAPGTFKMPGSPMPVADEGTHFAEAERFSRVAVVTAKDVAAKALGPSGGAE